MSGQSSSRTTTTTTTPSQETHQQEQVSQEQAFHQQPQQLKIRFSHRQNVQPSKKPSSKGSSITDSSREVIENMLTDGVHEILVPSSSSIQQPHLLQQAQQQVQTSQQKYPEENQFVIPLPVQTNQQSFGIPQQSQEQLLLQVPLQQPQQMLNVVNPGTTNTQMFLQVPQLQTNSNIPSQESPITSQQSHMRRAESLFLQASQQSAETDTRGNRLFIKPSHHNQRLQLQQPSDGSQQQNVQGTQQLLLRLSKQIPISSPQQPLQQAQPLLVQLLQQSSATPRQPCPEQKQHPFLQQTTLRPVQKIPVRSSLQQVRSTRQTPMQSFQRPLVPQSTQVFQQPNQRVSSFSLEIPQETTQIMQQMQSNQPSISSEQPVSQRIQQMFRQISQQPMLEVRGTNSENSSLLAQLTQMIQLQQMIQQSQVQSTQQPPFAQFIPWESLGVPLGILQVSESDFQSCQQSSQGVQDSLEIPEVSLFDLSPQQFMRIIQQCPYNGPSNQESSTKSARESSLQSRQAPPIPPGQESSTKLVRESLLKSGQKSSTSLYQKSSIQSSRQCPLLQGNQIRELPPESIASLNQINTSPTLNDTVMASVSIPNAGESQETFTEDSYENESNDDEASDNFISGSEATMSSPEFIATECMKSRPLQTVASEASQITVSTRPRNSSKSQKARADSYSDSTTGTAESKTGIAGYMDSCHTSGVNENSSGSFNNDYLAALISTTLAALTRSLLNQQTESDIPENISIISSLLNHLSNPNEINLRPNNNTSDNEAMQPRNELYQASSFKAKSCLLQILCGDQLTMQEVTDRLANLNARIESMSNLMNNGVMSSDSL
ncbi:hypothetical protein LOAG_07517 [Loa loa]|uniref:ULP_PROTEASE domain-containing protein n=1 Tax=Loa loa TaxID=7209 RepID=A0A1I7VY81_LOALO|nr:hypothetical protein LOAG_07517 [Loa loa]EFO20973.1 hypothetical protein LOAG_07517 [Loa loa]